MVAIMRTTLFSVVLLVLLALVDASPLSTAAPRYGLDRRQAPSVAAPNGWKVSWNKAGRLSNGASTNFISLFTVDSTATSVTQAHVNTCVSRCSTTSKCGFVNLIKMTGSSKGNVVCMLFPKYFASTLATYTNGPQSSGGTVQYSYGIRSNCTPTNGGALTCTPTVVASAPASTPSTTIIRATSSTTTSSASTAPTSSNVPWTVPTDASLPKAPAGATLVEWAPCSGTKLANPAMLNNAAISGSTATAAYIVQHGAGSDFDAYFTSLYNIVGNNYPLVSAGFLTDDKSSSYYRTGVNLAWGSLGDSWAVGADDTTSNSCSSYDQYDAIINYYNSNSAKFPRLSTIYFVGHSGGGNMVSRFSTINSNNPKTIKYVVANAANQAFFTDARPTSGAPSCVGALSYPYQWTTGTYNRYVGARAGSNPTSLFSNWKSRSVVFLTGDQDTDTGGTQLCQSQAQGGPYRRNRNYAYWAYQNILAGTGADVSMYSGYQELRNEGAATISSGGFNHQQCTISGVGHDADAIFGSSCGRAAIFGNSLPAGAGASYPSGYPN